MRSKLSSNITLSGKLTAGQTGESRAKEKEEGEAGLGESDRY